MERKEAVALGLNTYETGRPCKHGHVAYRYTDSGTCSCCINGKPLDINDKRQELFQMLSAHTSEIMVYGTPDIFRQIKEIADTFNRWKFPHIPPNYLNVYPFRPTKVRYSSMQRVKIVVPKGIEAEIKYLCACLLPIDIVKPAD